MNEAQERYLKNYSAVDKIDQMLLGWDLTYRSEVVACSHQACKSNCHEYGIFFVPSVITEPEKVGIKLFE
jgi:hypothetical protein